MTECEPLSHSVSTVVEIVAVVGRRNCGVGCPEFPLSPRTRLNFRFLSRIDRRIWELNRFIRRPPYAAIKNKKVTYIPHGKYILNFNTVHDPKLEHFFV